MYNIRSTVRGIQVIPHTELHFGLFYLTVLTTNLYRVFRDSLNCYSIGNIG